MSGAVVGVDPGSHKCGYAVVVAPREPPLEQGVVPAQTLVATIAAVMRRHAIRAIALGNGTRVREMEAALSELGLPIQRVDERETTLRARARYFEAHPPRGWRRLVPRGMLLPPVPIDDFAAILIAERLLEREERG